MKIFQYIIKDRMGLHARPTGELVMIANKMISEVTLEKENQVADLKNPVALMKLGVRCGDCVTVTAQGEDEEQVISQLKTFMEEVL